jgi:hypothetical protein
MLRIKKVVLIGGPFDGVTFTPDDGVTLGKFVDVRGTALRGVAAPDLSEKFRNWYLRYGRRNATRGVGYYEYRARRPVEKEHECK